MKLVIDFCILTALARLIFMSEALAVSDGFDALHRDLATRHQDELVIPCHFRPTNDARPETSLRIWQITFRWAMKSIVNTLDSSACMMAASTRGNQRRRQRALQSMFMYRKCFQLIIRAHHKSRELPPPKIYYLEFVHKFLHGNW